MLQDTARTRTLVNLRHTTALLIKTHRIALERKNAKNIIQNLAVLLFFGLFLSKNALMISLLIF